MRLALPGPVMALVPTSLIPSSPLSLTAVTLAALAVAYHGHKRGKKGRAFFYAGAITAGVSAYALYQEMQDDQELADAASECGYGDLGILPLLPAAAVAGIIARSKSVRRLRREIANLQRKRDATKNARRRANLSKRIAAKQAKLNQIIARLSERAARRQAKGKQPTRRQARVLNIPRIKPASAPLDMTQADDGTFVPVEEGPGEGLLPGMPEDLVDVGADAEAASLDPAASTAMTGSSSMTPWLIVGGLATVGIIGYALTRQRGDSPRRSAASAATSDRASRAA